MYLVGLRSDIRLWVEGSMINEAPTLDDYRKAALRADQALKGKVGGRAAIAALAFRQEPEETHEVAAFQRTSARPAAKKTSTYTRPAPGTGFFGQQRKLAKRQREFILCRKCSQWGQHFADECKLSNEARARLTKQSFADKPNGTPRDSQFPN